ncbi:MAG: YraN family protein [Methylotenera sp.]|uniref:YraN family protein n=1 Tax=Methylotenera sp. TaxID=2051956 RepID=UPI00271764AE|nr:YraN family protein [Methylotenera sp.]MDO9206409.1 YraN family protein [Methylotenera sp.]MDO9394127.1 YraN family protein [Methylotenera sp.]MDP1521822.1 YraN family protein [Methylotenera sp.]MDP3309009.1 YraN family protein [Methylotenera sp.]MDP3818453.1 YraN family protein [Methylotenera sp.]
MKLSKNNAGLEAEKIAATFLLDRGLKLVTQNYHCKFGEIDLIMKEAKILVFIEVRLRSNNQFGNAAASITPQKQQKLILTAQYYLQQHGDYQCRFDAILMDKADVRHIEWVRNAFDA